MRGPSKDGRSLRWKGERGYCTSSRPLHRDRTLFDVNIYQYLDMLQHENVTFREQLHSTTSVFLRWLRPVVYAGLVTIIEHDFVPFMSCIHVQSRMLHSLRWLTCFVSFKGISLNWTSHNVPGWYRLLHRGYSTSRQYYSNTILTTWPYGVQWSGRVADMVTFKTHNRIMAITTRLKINRC